MRAPRSSSQGSRAVLPAVSVQHQMEVGKSDEANMSDAVKSPHRFIVGRMRELDVCSTAFVRMLAGRRQMVLISGEPGIGKTCCAEAVAESAEHRGALVL